MSKKLTISVFRVTVTRTCSLEPFRRGLLKTINNSWWSLLFISILANSRDQFGGRSALDWISVKAPDQVMTHITGANRVSTGLNEDSVLRYKSLQECHLAGKLWMILDGIQRFHLRSSSSQICIWRCLEQITQSFTDTSRWLRASTHPLGWNLGKEMTEKCLLLLTGEMVK